jgi:hypothetical protein
VRRRALRPACAGCQGETRNARAWRHRHNALPQGFVGRHHPNDAAIVGAQSLAAPQHRAAVEHEADFLAGRKSREKPALLAEFERQDEIAVAGGRGVRPFANRDHQNRK